MKKILACIAGLLVSGCVNPNKPAELKPMNIRIERYPYSLISWDRPEGENLRYEVLMRTVSGADGGNAGTMMYVVPETSESFSGSRYLAYYAQENEYYGMMQYQVTAYENDRAVAQGSSEPFLINDYFPAKKELIIGQDVPLDEITSFSYSGTGDTPELIFSYTVEKTEDGYHLTAEYSDETGKHEADKDVEEDVWNQLKEYIGHGTIRREYAQDPEIEILDGSESSYQLKWNGMSKLESAWYEWIPAEKEQAGVNRYLNDICE